MRVDLRILGTLPGMRNRVSSVPGSGRSGKDAEVDVNGKGIYL